jgi:hypothetical protein
MFLFLSYRSAADFATVFAKISGNGAAAFLFSVRFLGHPFCYDQGVKRNAAPAA